MLYNGLYWLRVTTKLIVIQEEYRKATGQNGFPTYIVLNGTKQVQTILVGSPALEEWLSTHR